MFLLSCLCAIIQIAGDGGFTALLEALNICPVALVPLSALVFISVYNFNNMQSFAGGTLQVKTQQQDDCSNCERHSHGAAGVHPHVLYVSFCSSLTCDSLLKAL